MWPQRGETIRGAGKSEGSSSEWPEPGNVEGAERAMISWGGNCIGPVERGIITWDGNCVRPEAEEQSLHVTACEKEASVEWSYRVQSSQSILGDAVSLPHSYRKCHIESDKESDSDSDFWDEELLSFSADRAMEQVTIPCSDVCMPPPPDQKSEWYSSQMIQRSTPNEHGLTPVYVSLVNDVFCCSNILQSGAHEV